jgi:hypothetical protein
MEASGFVAVQLSGSFAACVRVCFAAGVRVCCSSCQDVSRRRDRSWQEAIKQLKRREMFIHGIRTKNRTMPSSIFILRATVTVAKKGCYLKF